MKFEGKKVLMVGLARSGYHAIKLLHEIGSEVTVSDSKPMDKLADLLKEVKPFIVDYIIGVNPSSCDKYDIIVLSPGVPLDLPFIQDAKEKGITIIGEIELAYQVANGNFIGITGTNGKTTTTALVGEIFSNTNEDFHVVGNIGIAATSRALNTKEETVLVTEISSFQLETIDEFTPKIGAILNITPDHLNRHITMENYIEAKKNIARNQGCKDILILNYDDAETRKIAKTVKSKIVWFSRKKIMDNGVFLVDGSIAICENGNKIDLCKAEDLFILGDHNIENAMAAVAITYNYGVEVEAIRKGLLGFKGFEHRIEFVREIDGVKYYNDSKATNPESSIAAVKAMKNKTHLIAGGMDKKSEFDELIKSFNSKIESLILFGETKNIIADCAIRNGYENIFIVNDLDEAVNKAFEVSNNGEVVLLSPSCASWDMYENFEVRGNHFKQCVIGLEGEISE